METRSALLATVAAASMLAMGNVPVRRAPLEPMRTPVGKSKRNRAAIKKRRKQKHRKK